MSHLLELRHISKTFFVGRRDLKSSLLSSRREAHSFILKDINFTLKKGESLGIIGVNGSGKSTLLKIIAGLIKPSSGMRLLKGTVNPVANIFGSLHSELSLEENIRFFYSITSIEHQNENDFVRNVLEFSELTHKKSYTSGHLSTGEEARLSFSMTMFCEAELYLLDECLSVGDIFFKEKCRELIAQLKAKEKSFITVSHDHEEILHLCDRVVWIKDGFIVKEGKPSYLLEEYARRQ